MRLPNSVSCIQSIAKMPVRELKRVLVEAISLFGAPKLIVADRERMFTSNEFVSWISELGSDIHYITPEMHRSNGQAERYMRTILNMLRIEVNHRNSSWLETLWKLKLVLNMTKQKTTQASTLNIMVGIEGTTPVIRALIRDVVIEGTSPNRERLVPNFTEVGQANFSRKIKSSRMCALTNKYQYLGLINSGT